MTAGFKLDLGRLQRWVYEMAGTVEKQGYGIAASDDEVRALTDAVDQLCSPELTFHHHTLCLQTMLVLDTALTTKEQVPWGAIGDLGMTRTGELPFQLTDDPNLQWYAALRLTNNAIARCMCGNKTEIGLYAEKVARTALGYFEQRKERNRCVAALHVVLAHCAFDPRGVQEHATEALEILNKGKVSAEGKVLNERFAEGSLRTQAERLLGSVTPGPLNAALRRVPSQIRPLTPTPRFIPDDFCLFRD